MYIKENKITFFLRNKIKLLVTLFIIKIIARTKLFFKIIFNFNLYRKVNSSFSQKNEIVIASGHEIVAPNPRRRYRTQGIK